MAAANIAKQILGVQNQQQQSQPQQRPRTQANNPQDMAKNIAAEAGRGAVDAIGEQLGVGGGQQMEQQMNPDAFDEQAYREQLNRQEQQKLAQLRQALEQEMAMARGERVQSQQQYTQSVEEQFRQQDLDGKTEEEFVQAQQMTDQQINAQRRGNSETGKRNKKG